MIPATPDGLQTVSDAAGHPLYRQIYERFRGAIAEGTLKPGDRIPSARALAKEIGVARGTIEVAYSLLASEGYIQARGQAGTVVAPNLQPLARSAPAAKARPAEAQEDGWQRPAAPLPFQMGLPALDAFPRKIWARLGARHLRGMQPPDLAYPDPSGLLALRTATAAYLQVARGIQCTPSQVFITTGYNNTLQLIMQALFKPGDSVWVEDPGYPPTRALLAQAGMQAVPVRVDAQGLVVQAGIAQDPRARAAVVTPAHQSPLCLSLSLPRRQALLDWAERSSAWIVEDDYDGEYRYVGRPLPALKSLDRQGRVLYSGTFSKVLFPGMRLAYLVVPEEQAPRFERLCLLLAGGAPALTQAVLASFINEGHFARHIQRMRRLYSERREATAAALSSVLGNRLRIDPQPGGMHLVARLDGHQTDRELAARMLRQGLYAHALSHWSAAPDARAGLLMSFTNIVSAEQAEQLARRILQLM
ncbi:HTH-type transcriptional regulatory protein GabR [Achromobacter mucicolens]|uniref:MocR-like pyridoxine biosynthesis transcription factor PdxR n=1 Tax=Achromobacter mucicolens TaxID=1389922 RepID=UPI0009C4C440|nr:PLP-dependent aminotransferase family protein [Achromobacter mucicolens]OXC89571.1 DNA-binding protein [Achromobacter sp. KAs 3-5]CAB3635713.1 HTH-type transcriptional regulatory protein GabR [Achromobacter mucicolens]